MNIIKAVNNDAEILTEITKASKAFWGYSLEQMQLWDKILTIDEIYIDKNFVYKLAIENQIIGYYSYYFIDEKNIMLDNLFVLPEYIGKGFGNHLMKDFIIRIKSNETVEKIRLEADPNAENFYLKNGFKTIGKIETSINNRFLPIMEFQ